MRPVQVLRGLVPAVVFFACVPGVCSDQTAPAVPAAAAVNLEILKTGDNISISAIAVQADELFTQLSQKTGVGIIVDDTVGRRDGDKFVTRSITLNLHEKKLKEIVEYICAAYGLSHSQTGNVIMISEGIPKNPSSFLMSDIDSVTTEYVRSSDAKSWLPEFLQAHVKVNDGKNAVILSGPSEVLAKFRQDVKQFDVPAAQVMIDVIMVEFTNTAGKELGFDFYWANGGKSIGTSTSTGDITFHSLGSLTNQFTATIKALVDKNLAKVHANPRIATVSGQKASIFVGRQRYLNQPVEVSSGGTLNFIDAGIKLDMTPWTGGSDEIISEINTEVSVMSAPDPITGLPEKSTRRANTQVRAKDGETIIIGGLVQNELQSTRTKLPLFGDLPLIGKAFQSQKRTETQTELVIFVTPRILRAKDMLTKDQAKCLLDEKGSDKTGRCKP